MARKRNKKKSTALLKKLGIICATLVVIQIVVVKVIFGKAKPTSLVEAVDQKLKGLADVPDERKQLIRVQMFVQDYMVKHKGKPPASLKELVPEYLATVPVNPKTKQPIEYAVVDGKPKFGAIVPEGAAGGELVQVKLSENDRDLLIASMDEAEEKFIYDATGKADPFKPFTVARPVSAGETVLERTPISSLRLAIVMGMGESAKALVEDGTGKGHHVVKGTKIGVNGGEVVEILPDRLLILEVSEDFTGQKHHNQIELLLRPGGAAAPGKLQRGG